MSKPAARARIDKAAHMGIILQGSSNVFIGGGLAARKGDKIICSQHPISSITGGSSTVLINGLPAARKDDSTLCSSINVVESEGAAAPVYGSLTPLKNVTNDGKLDGYNNANGRILTLYIGKEDINQNGTYDTVKFGGALADIAIGNMDDENARLRGEINFKAITGDATIGLYGGNGIYGEEVSAEVVGIQYGGKVGSNNPITGDYSQLAGDVTFGTAGFDATHKHYLGHEGKYGMSGKLGAEAKAFDASVTAERSSLFGIIKTKTKVSGSVGSVGGSVGAGAYVDTNDYSLNLSLSGALELAAGVGLDVDVSISLKPIIDFFAPPKDVPAPLDGIILTGCATVFIG